ncbi:MAG: glycosyltransferase N-terminal domain-containing protein [Lentimicrobiaceae bacterium]|jgi:3-deoxy-D-manno-octulosonic-acid transferase
MQQIYSFLIVCYGLSIRVASVFNKKAALWIKGRQQYWTILEKIFASAPFNLPGRKLAWFHCASLGEFEQGRPIMEAFRQQHPEYLILLTFYSPSGYEVRKAYNGADRILYLPLDTQSNVRKFVDTVNPDIVFYVKYEFWFNFLSYLQLKNIPTLLVSAVFRPEQHFFKGYGEWPRKILQGVTKIFVQNEDSKELLQFIGIENVEVSGDTRFDRVAAVAATPIEIEIALAFSLNHKVIIAGSTWPADEDLIFKLIYKNKHKLRFIIAPHEISADHIDALMLRAGKTAVRFSKTNPHEAATAEILIIDSIGMLSQLYQYGTIAYIGGGFGVGIHNILEAAAFGLPVFFGPTYHKFNEAKEMIDLGGAFEVNTPDELIHKTNLLLSDKKALSKASSISKNYVLQGCGATEIILKRVNELIMLKTV